MEQYIDTTGTNARMVDLTNVGLTIQAALVQKTEEIDTRVPQTVFEITADNQTLQAVADQTGFARTDEIVLPHRNRESIAISAEAESGIGKVSSDTNIDIRAILASVRDSERQLEEIVEGVQQDRKVLKRLLSFPDKAAARISGLRLAVIVPDLMVRGYAIYKEAEWSEDVLKAAMPLQSPLNAIIHFRLYQHVDGSEKILKTAARRNPAAAIERFCEYAGDDKTPSVLAIKILQVAARVMPELAIQYFKKYGGGCDDCWPPDSLTRPKWAIDVLKQAAEQKPELAIRYYGLYQSFPLLYKDGESKLEVDKERQAILERAAIRDPNTAVEHSASYSRDPDSRRILKAAAERNPLLAIRKDLVGLDETWVEERIDSDPQVVIEYLNYYPHLNLLRIRIIKKLLKKHPFISTDAIQEQGDVRVALRELSQENPLFYIRLFFT